MRLVIGLFLPLVTFGQIGPMFPGPGLGASGGSSGVTLITHACGAGQSGGGGNPQSFGTTPCTGGTINTVGASLLVICVSDLGTGSGSDVISDTISGSSTGNIWTVITNTVQNAGSSGNAIFYSYHSSGGALVTGASHAISITGSYSSAGIEVFSGTQVSSDPLSSSAGAAPTGGGGAVQPGSVTPAIGDLVVSGCQSVVNGATFSINLGFTITDQVSYDASTKLGMGAAYLISTTGSAVNPTWTTSSGNPTAGIAVFHHF